MTDRYEAVAVRKYTSNGEEKSAFTNIGVAFAMKGRDGYSVRLHCLPAPVDGEYTILLMPPKPKDDRQQSGGNGGGQSHGGGYSGGGQSQSAESDDIPFSPPVL